VVRPAMRPGYYFLIDAASAEAASFARFARLGYDRVVNNDDLPRQGPQAVHTNLFGGVGEVRVLSLLQTASAPFTAVLSCELSPGGSVGAHMQPDFPELVIGVAGDGEARVDGVVHRLDASHAVYLPLGAALEIVNRSEREPLRYLIVKARGG
jgi:quercetin dioxygenase-like cupin family protein